MVHHYFLFLLWPDLLFNHLILVPHTVLFDHCFLFGCECILRTLKSILNLFFFISVPLLITAMNYQTLFLLFFLISSFWTTSNIYTLIHLGPQSTLYLFIWFFFFFMFVKKRKRINVLLLYYFTFLLFSECEDIQYS